MITYKRKNSVTNFRYTIFPWFLVTLLCNYNKSNFKSQEFFTKNSKILQTSIEFNDFLTVAEISTLLKCKFNYLFKYVIPASKIKSVVASIMEQKNTNAIVFFDGED